ncbi:hypothetical protein [Actinomadura sp. WMMA1423]|uniref:hypothetical protein n=1 Tax=Actinomadura sp. WMMA1423 TaxID=2591108 RepID=UPI00197A9482|nr:hypothetical protein [Actinomadura sp. WMMA1423]
MTAERPPGRRAESLGATMRAARVHDFGGPEVIRCERVPRPAPGPGEVLLRVAAAGSNPSDVGFRGSEAAGTVVRTGKNVDRDITAERPLADLPDVHRDARSRPRERQDHPDPLKEPR